MVKKENAIGVEDCVIGPLSNTIFQVELDSGHKVLVRINSKIHQRYIHILPEDRVVAELSPYDFERRRIVCRYKQIDLATVGSGDGLIYQLDRNSAVLTASNDDHVMLRPGTSAVRRGGSL